MGTAGVPGLAMAVGGGGDGAGVGALAGAGATAATAAAAVSADSGSGIAKIRRSPKEAAPTSAPVSFWVILAVAWNTRRSGGCGLPETGAGCTTSQTSIAVRPSRAMPLAVVFG